MRQWEGRREETTGFEGSRPHQMNTNRVRINRGESSRRSRGMRLKKAFNLQDSVQCLHRISVLKNIFQLSRTVHGTGSNETNTSFLFDLHNRPSPSWPCPPLLFLVWCCLVTKNLVLCCSGLPCPAPAALPSCRLLAPRCIYSV